MSALGRWLQLNPETAKQHTVSTWRLAGGGDLLGYTLAINGNAVVAGVVNAKNSGANFAPIPAEPSRWTLEEVTGWSLSEAMRRIEAGEVSVRDFNAMYRASGGNPRVTWTAITEPGEAEPVGMPYAGVFVATGNVNGIVPLHKVLTGEKKIILRSADLYERTYLSPSPTRKDGLPQLSTVERLRLITRGWPEGLTSSGENT